jgi:uncharacterized protein with LGFP repeats
VAFEVHGLIRQKWADLGWENSFLGFPLSDESNVIGKPGRTNTFEGGVISWTPGTGAHEVHGAILARWLAIGREAGFGFPLTDETGTPDGRGRFNHFETGSIYWTPQTNAHEIVGAMQDVWASQGWERGPGRNEAEQFYVRHCFPDAATADAFRDRFGGRRVTYTPERGRRRV